VLSFDLCVDAFEIAVGRQQLTTLKGLQKNHPLPAKGSGTYRTSEDVRPGKKQDIINIPIYEGKAGTKAIHNDFRGIVQITGDQLTGLLPKGSDVELKISIDQSEDIEVTATFPYLEDQMVDDVLKKTKKSPVTKNHLKKELKKAQNELENLEEEYAELDAIKVEEIRTGLNELKDSLEKGGSAADKRDEILNNMREYCIEIDVLESTGEWPKVMQDLTDAIEGLEKSIEEYGGEKAAQLLKQIHTQVKTFIDAQDVKMAKRLTQQIDSISFAVVDQGAGVAMEISLIKGFDDNFDMHDWKDEGQARNLINQAKGIINANNATKEILRPIVGQLYQLLPMAPGPDGGPGKGGIIY
jgi:molecular chaperone DnaK